MRDVDDADVLLAQALDDPEEGIHLVEGEGGGGLVEDEHLGVAHHAAQDLDHALLGDGERGGLAVGVEMPADLIHDLHELAVEVGLARVEADGHVLAHRHVGEEHGLLRHHVDAVLEGDLGVGDVDLLVVDVDLAAVGAVDAHDDLHERGLAGAVAADEGENLAGAQVKADALEHVVGPERLVDVADREKDVLLLGDLGLSLLSGLAGLVCHGHYVSPPHRRTHETATLS